MIYLNQLSNVYKYLQLSHLALLWADVIVLVVKNIDEMYHHGFVYVHVDLKLELKETLKPGEKHW